MITSMKRVLGLELDGTTLHATFARTRIPILGATYGDSLNPEELSDAGTQEITAITSGTYKTDAVTIKVAGSVFRALLMPRLPFDGFGMFRFPLVVAFVHPELGNDSDLLEDCRIVNPKGAFDNSAKAQEIELALKVRQIYWTNRRMTLNQLDLSSPLGDCTL